MVLWAKFLLKLMCCVNLPKPRLITSWAKIHRKRAVLEVLVIITNGMSITEVHPSLRTRSSTAVKEDGSGGTPQSLTQIHLLEVWLVALTSMIVSMMFDPTPITQNQLLLAMQV